MKKSDQNSRAVWKRSGTVWDSWTPCGKPVWWPRRSTESSGRRFSAAA